MGLALPVSRFEQTDCRYRPREVYFYTAVNILSTYVLSKHASEAVMLVEPELSINL
jgi:hypothetical protein